MKAKGLNEPENLQAKETYSTGTLGSRPCERDTMDMLYLTPL